MHQWKTQPAYRSRSFSSMMFSESLKSVMLLPSCQRDIGYHLYFLFLSWWACATPDTLPESDLWGLMDSVSWNQELGTRGQDRNNWCMYGWNLYLSRVDRIRPSLYTAIVSLLPPTNTYWAPVSYINWVMVDKEWDVYQCWKAHSLAGAVEKLGQSHRGHTAGSGVRLWLDIAFPWILTWCSTFKNLIRVSKTHFLFSKRKREQEAQGPWPGLCGWSSVKEAEWWEMRPERWLGQIAGTLQDFHPEWDQQPLEGFEQSRTP